MTLTARLWNILRARIGRVRRSFVPSGGSRGGDFADGQEATSGYGETRYGGAGYGGAWDDTGAGQRDRAARSTAGTGQDPILAGYYANLEVPYGADLEAVERAWKRLLRKYHPDRHATNPERQKTANELVKQLNRAYAELRGRLEKKSA